MTDVRYMTSVAALRMMNQSAALDMTPDDYEFFTSDRIWTSVDRSRARRCVEAAVYGTLDFCGYPRFPAPAEFIAAAIAHFVHPINIQTACLIMGGTEFTENVINGVERVLEPAELFAHTLRVRAGSMELCRSAEDLTGLHLKGNPNV